MIVKYVFIIIFLFIPNCSIYNNPLVKGYQADLKLMMDKSEADVTNQITSAWGFKLLDRWTAEDPSLEFVRKNDYRHHGFSKKEIRDLFSSKGKYSVLIFLKTLDISRAQLGKINEMGLPLPESRQTASSAEYCYLRVVFRNKGFVHFELWKIVGPNPNERNFEIRK